MTSLEIPFDDVDMVFSNDHTFGLDCLTAKPNSNFPSDSHLTIDISLDSGINESL